jgi:hypothetical protein
MRAALGDFDVATEATPSGYDSYTCVVRSHSAENSFTIRAADVPVGKHPFTTGDDMAQFITYRLHGFFTSAAGFEGHMPVSHRRMAPWSGELLAGRFDTWEELEILEPGEVSTPYSVLVEPTIDFRLHPPRPLPL